MEVKLGIDLIDSHKNLLKDARIGLVTNHAGLNSTLESIIDILNSRFNLVKLFAPEHGVRGSGVLVDIDSRTGLPIQNLYGKSERFTREMVEDIDVIAVDLPDVGARHYTYLHTMAYAMQASAKYGKVCVVFDRPNPLGGIEVEGNILDESVSSIVGLYPIVNRHGLTFGELAKLFNEEYGIGCDLKVVGMSGYWRDMHFEDTGLDWVLPSPNIPNPRACYLFCTTCLFEGTNVSEGRGTSKPFAFIGAPWIDSMRLADYMNAKKLPAVRFRSHYFKPTFSKYTDEQCEGIEIHILDIRGFKPVLTGLHLLYAIRDMHKEFEFIPPRFDRLAGNTFIREGRYGLDKVIEIYERDSEEFGKVKAKYHLYD